MKILKYIVEIIIMITLFQTCAFGQTSQLPLTASSNEEEIIVETSYKEYTLYMEAWKKNDLESFDKEELERRYNQFVEDVDRYYHGGGKQALEEKVPEEEPAKPITDKNHTKSQI